mmetsp:Transcript_9357/g.29115  ORF Transcript_9357/g.29115 Transcript_9357/m.29115 type:complete len:84 (+) Transcript_9357:1298-1549(+)
MAVPHRRTWPWKAGTAYQMSSFLSSCGQDVMKIVDDGTTGNQHEDNTVGVIESKGGCLASKGALVEDITPHHADPNVGMVEVA